MLEQYTRMLQDVAAECKVRAMPTFQVYVQGRKVEEVNFEHPSTRRDHVFECSYMLTHTAVKVAPTNY